MAGQELIISNRELTGARVNNYRRMKKRRVEFKFGLVYDTGSKKLERVPKIIEKIINEIEGVEHKRTHLKTLGDSSLIFESVYMIDNASYEQYMDTRQHINLEMIRQFEDEKIEFAYPTQTILLKQ